MKIGPFEIHPQRIAIFFGIAILLFLIMDFNTRLEGLSRLQNQLSTVQAQGTNVVMTQYALQTGVAYATSDAAVQEYARSQAHMIQPGDNVIVPLPVPGSTPPPPATPTPVLANLTNWDVWMQYLFGK